MVRQHWGMGVRRLRGHLSILLSIESDELPTEIRIFRRGPNETRKGVFVFDAQAASDVMTAYALHGVDIMIDLEHLSLDRESVNYDPDARCWCCLEVRDGELWVTNMRWTPEGAERLRAKTQRYLSPAFDHDEDGRVCEIINIGLTSLPATDCIPALVAASASYRGKKSMNPKMMLQLLSLLRSGQSADEACVALAIDPKTFQAMAKLLGADPSDMAAVIGAVSAWLDEFKAAAGGQPPKEPKEPKDEKPAEPTDDAAPAMASRAETELEQLKRQTAERSEADRKELETLRRAVAETEAAERRKLVVSLVKLGRETPFTAWQNADGRTPKGSLAVMPIAELREREEMFRRLAGVSVGGAPVLPGSGAITQTNDYEISEYEQNRLRATAKREGTDYDVALTRYQEIKGQQIRGAQSSADQVLARMIARPLAEQDVLCDVLQRPSRSFTTLSTPVKPIEEFGSTSQRALEEFRVEYMATLAALPQVWAERIGTVLSSGSLKETYPVDFAVSKYAMRVTENAPARTANVKEITVSKDEYLEAEQCELRRLLRGDFAYLRSWDNKAARLARARQFLRNHLVAAKLEANGTWVDGLAYFSGSHLVDPFDTSRTFRGSATWSNYQSGTAAPLTDSTKLTEEKELFLYSTPGPDGEEMGYEADGLLYPTILHQTAKNMLTVQDLILEGAATAPTRNPHYMTGLEMVRAPELTGTATTANWYLFSRAAIAAGLVPWVVSEDPTEEVRIWDESSDFYKGSGMIKYESHVLVSCVLVYPHAIRRVDGT